MLDAEFFTRLDQIIEQSAHLSDVIPTATIIATYNLALSVLRKVYALGEPTCAEHFPRCAERFHIIERPGKVFPYPDILYRLPVNIFLGEDRTVSRHHFRYPLAQLPAVIVRGS